MSRTRRFARKAESRKHERTKTRKSRKEKQEILEPASSFFFFVFLSFRAFVIRLSVRTGALALRLTPPVGTDTLNFSPAPFR
jgi:hypothetical protein